MIGMPAATVRSQSLHAEFCVNSSESEGPEVDAPLASAFGRFAFDQAAWTTTIDEKD